MPPVDPVIRVTSQQPVNEPLLTFLISVDWGQGRLVREYSALLDTPRTVSAPLQPQIDEAMVSAPNTIERLRSNRPPAPSAGRSHPIAAVGRARPKTTPLRPRQRCPDPNLWPSPQPPPVPASAPAQRARGELRVRSPGDTLSEIAGRCRATPASRLDQTMIALLRANPDAFIGGNINRLRRGAVLRVPAGDELASVEAAQAGRLVSSQMQQWRDRAGRSAAGEREGGAIAAGAVGAPGGRLGRTGCCIAHGRCASGNRPARRQSRHAGGYTIRHQRRW